MIERLAILGPGLLGGSLAGAVRQKGLAREIRVWARSRAKAAAVVARPWGESDQGWADVATDHVEEAVEGADFIVLATPVGAMPELARRIADCRTQLAPQVLITDVGSVKGFVATEVAPILEGAGLTFIGSHPMAGGERAGFEAARADLFEGAACVLTPHAASLPRLRAFWEALGCRLFVMKPQEHDEAVARISHLPHAVASILTLAALAEAEATAALAGNGLRDSTRIAAGDAALWTEILLENRQPVLSALETMQHQLADFLEALRAGEAERLHERLEEARRLRALLPPRPHV